MWWTWQAMEWTGQVAVLVASWWITWPLHPFFWLEKFEVVAVVPRRVVSGAAFEISTLLIQREIMHRQNCPIWWF